ncbi:hypothetical protein E2C01_085507 [Portunus trituberculatus]|uniref:Uncharacterized protein n=1 Tax=Portunus trituberculatus TaxID=210409 RepID=A0A5B7J928_PORTR|nr:hypothetical protein [Portunus trituberculatus]
MGTEARQGSAAGVRPAPGPTGKIMSVPLIMKCIARLDHANIIWRNISPSQEQNSQSSHICKTSHEPIKGTEDGVFQKTGTANINGWNILVRARPCP